MDFEIYDDFSLVDKTEWEALLAESITDVPFLHYDYLLAWWRTRGGGEWPDARLILITGREQGQLVGVAPLFLADHEGHKALLLVGSIEISDYLDLIVRSLDLTRFISGLLDFLHSQVGSLWESLDWYNLPEESPAINALKFECGKRIWHFSSVIYKPAPAIMLPGNFEAYLATVEKKQRHEIRRKIRRVEESGRGRWFIVRDGAILENEIQQLFILMEGDPEKAKFLTNSMREQMRFTIELAFKQGWLWLAVLEIDGIRAAAALNFDYKNKLWGYNSGVNRNFMELSPGWVLLAYSLQWAAENGRKEFDFMRGDEGYKYRFGAVNRHVMRVSVNR